MDNQSEILKPAELDGLTTIEVEEEQTLAIIYLGVVVTIFAYGLYNFGVSRVPASQAAAFVNLIPVFSVILGILVLKEKMMHQQWFACSLIFCGILISRLGATAVRREILPTEAENRT